MLGGTTDSWWIKTMCGGFSPGLQVAGTCSIGAPLELRAASSMVPFHSVDAVSPQEA
jgi:hypothetical protein